MELELKDWEKQNTLDMKEDEGRLGMKNSGQEVEGKGRREQRRGIFIKPQDV